MANWVAAWLPRIMALGTDRRLPVLAALLCLLLLSQGLAALTWRLLPSPELAAPVATSTTIVAGGKGRSQTLAHLDRLHLFGEPPKLAPTAVAQVIEAPETRLSLKLLGLVASSNPVNARAIIADSKGEEDAYAVGDKLPGDATLREIYADRIILEYHGRLETLRLPQEPSLASADSGTMQAAKGRPVAQVVNPTSVGGDTGALLRQYRDSLMTDPQSVLDLVRAEPVRNSSGGLKGYRIFPGRDRQVLGRFGLRAGDVVTAINGVSMDNPLKALELVRDLSSVDQISVDVERNGSMQSFNFQIE